MSKELKTYDLPVDHGDFTSAVELFYLKSEADAVIAELENEVETQKRLRDMALASVPNALKVAKIIQHNKYKRCLAIADGCQDKIKYWHIRYTTAAGYDRSYEKWKHRLFTKWRKRWLAIAEEINFCPMCGRKLTEDK